MTVPRLCAWLAGLSLGLSLGWHSGFEAGVREEEAMSRERSACYCHLDCCDDHHAVYPLDSCQRGTPR